MLAISDHCPLLAKLVFASTDPASGEDKPAAAIEETSGNLADVFALSGILEAPGVTIGNGLVRHELILIDEQCNAIGMPYYSDRPFPGIAAGAALVAGDKSWTIAATRLGLGATEDVRPWFVTQAKLSHATEAISDDRVVPWPW